jgi:hypothetical protein
MLIFLALMDATILPPWAPTYNMSLSTIMMPCNYSGLMDAATAGMWGIVDFDWSNGKQLWANAKPMDCQERLVIQADAVKNISSSSKVFVYRNLVKALPWYTSVRQKLVDPAYSGFFLKFKDGVHGAYRVNACTGSKCSAFYHDQDQTPEHPRGDGSCTDDCDCGKGLPCGEYLWDHRNGSMLRRFLIDEFVMGSDGVAHPSIDGVFLDDGWTDSPEPHAAWWPKEGFCSADAIGGPTEEYPNCTVDMGLTQADTTAIKAEWSQTIAELRSALVAAGGFNWQMFSQSTDAPVDATACRAYFSHQCQPGGGPRSKEPWVYQFTDPKAGRHLPNVTQDVATFLLARGAYAWIGYGWIGCTSASKDSLEYFRPPALDVDYGVPVDDGCKAGMGQHAGVFTREWSKATVRYDCNTMKAAIEMK